MPRVPLPDVGVTSIRETYIISCEDITPRSSLLQTHSSIPCGSPLLRRFRLVRGVLAGCVQPCCHRDLPDVILRIVPVMPEPIPRRFTECSCLVLPQCHRPSPCGNMGRLPHLSANAIFHGPLFEAAAISLCSGLTVCSPHRSLPPLQFSPQGGRGFYVRAERASSPPHASDMLSARLQAIGGTRTSTSQDSQLCRLLTPLPSFSERDSPDSLSPASPQALRFCRASLVDRAHVANCRRIFRRSISGAKPTRSRA